MVHPASGKKENETPTENTKVEIMTETASLPHVDSKVDNESNGSSEIFSLPFGKSHYQFNSTEGSEDEDKIKMKPYY
jgi:hypothetical protein